MNDAVILRDLELALNINNAFEQDPPLYRKIGASTAGSISGFSPGRLVQVGISNKF